jgi:hypothetical protein
MADKETPEVVTVNVAVVDPAATFTVEGTGTAELLEFSATAAPPLGAGRANVTVPTAGFPPTTAEGDKEIPTSKGV